MEHERGASHSSLVCFVRFVQRKENAGLKMTQGCYLASLASAEGTTCNSLGRESQVCDGIIHAFTQSQPDGMGRCLLFDQRDDLGRRVV